MPAEFRVTLAQLRAHGARVVASCLAIVIAVGFVVATLSLNATAKAGVLQAVGAQFVASDVIATNDDPYGGDDALAHLEPALAALPGVAAVAADRSTYVEVRLPDRSGATSAQADSVGTPGPLQWQRVTTGRLPRDAGEIAVSDRVDVTVGSTVALSWYPVGDALTDSLEPVTQQVTVVGTVDLSGDPRAGLMPRIFGTDEALVSWGASSIQRLRISAAAGTTARSLQQSVADAAAGSTTVSVTTGVQAAQDVADGYTGDASSITAVLLAFGAIAVLVAGLVIANTFAVLLAQRTRELALLRCVGADRGQIGRSVLGEAFVVGLLASLAGVLAGFGLAQAVAAVAGRVDSPIPLAEVVMPSSAVVVGVLVGTLVTVLAAAAPARAATRVAPLAALRPVTDAPVRSRAGIVRLVLGLVITIPSTVLLVLFASTGQLVPALVTGALSFLGVLLLAQRVVPVAVALAGRPFRRLGGIPAQLAAGNSVRNPRRTAATATALVIGVTLTTAMVVGTSSTRASALQGMDASYPTDVVVSGGEPLGQNAVDALRGVGQVRGIALVEELHVTTADGSSGFSMDAVDPAVAADVVRSQGRSPLPQQGQIVLSADTAESAGVVDGDRLTLRTDTGTPGPDVEFSVLVAPDTQQPAVATAADAARLDPGVQPTAAWVRLADGDSDTQAAATDEISEALAQILPTSDVQGVASLRNSLDEILTTMLLIVTGLLAVAVVIALIGVGNTLALSVVERRQESGLLRALGLTRGQLRSVLAWEALLVAGVAAVIGVALGTGYGLAGTSSVLGAEMPVVLAVPWTQVLGIVLVAAAAGVLASVLPARRAAKTPPVAAIAD